MAQAPLGNIRHDVAPREGRFEKFEPNNEGFYASYRDLRSLADDLQGVFLYLDADIGDNGKRLSLIVYGYIYGELYFLPDKTQEMTKDFGAARRGDYDPAFGKRLISICAVPPHLVRNIALATVCNLEHKIAS